MGRVVCQEGHRRHKKKKAPKQMTQNNKMALSPWRPFGGQRVQRITRLGGRAHDGGDCGVLKVYSKCGIFEGEE